MNNERNNTTAGGIGFCGLLAVAFIVLKLTGVINWSWLWVLAPIWIVRSRPTARRHKWTWPSRRWQS